MKVLFVKSGNHGLDSITRNQAESLTSPDCEILNFEIVGKGIWGYLKNIISIRKKVRNTNVDIIHAHYAYSGILAALSLCKKPIVTSLMGSDVNDAGKILLLIFRFFVRYIWDATIVKSERMAQRLAVKNLYIIPNGVNLILFNQLDRNYAISQLGWDGSIKNVLFGSDPRRPEKNFQLCQSAFNIVKSNFPELEIHFLNNVHNKDVIFYYNAADLLMLSSISEGSPNVVKEAMACNCPIVSTDVGDVKSIIEGTEGCFISDYDHIEFASKIKYALDYGKRTTGRNRILHLDDKIISEKIFSIYKKLTV